MAAASANISKLRGMGLSEAMVQEIGKMDPRQAAKLTARILADPGMASALNSSYGRFENIGFQMSAGLADGMLREERRIEDSLAWLAGNMVGALKDVLKISSPSRVMAEQGRMVSLGLARGIGDEYRAVRTAMRDIGVTPNLTGRASVGDARIASGAGGTSVQIDVHPAPGMSERQLARAVGREFGWRM